MLQGDQDWWRLADVIEQEDQAQVEEHNTHASAEQRLDRSFGPVPSIGAAMRAPVVLLLGHPPLCAGWSAEDYTFRRSGWPFALLHPDAPAGPRDWWRTRLSGLVDLFGAHHVANAVAAIFLVPWCARAMPERVRVPSRRRMLNLAASAAARDAVLLMLRDEHLWTEHAVIAALPASRRFNPKVWRVDEFNARTLGDEAWSTICTRIAIHTWS